VHDPTYWQRRGSNHTLDVLSFEVYPEPSAGEAVFLKAGQEPIRQVLHAVKSTPCVFEYIYFARPDSVMDGKSVYERRLGYRTSVG
jgi:amidophosphoribosyltransferase